MTSVPSERPSFFSPRTTKLPLAKISVTVTVTEPVKLAACAAVPVPVLAVLAVRFAWGFVGPQEARFSSFLPNPFAALRHIQALLRKLGGKRETLPEYSSHNPAGAVMIYALWAMLALVCITGLVMAGGASPVQMAQQQAIVETGDWSTLVQADEEGEDAGEGAGGAWAKEVHEVAANLVVILALIHVAGVALESRALGRNLVRPMLRKS